MALELNRIYNMDCLEGMRQMGDKSVDLSVTSPPYDNLRTYKGFSFDFEGIAKELYRITKDGGVLVWVVGDATIDGSETGTSFRQALYFKEIGFNLHDTMIWDKGSCRYPETNRYYPCFEYMFVLSKGKPITSNLIEDRKNKYGGGKVSRGSQIRTTEGEMKPNSAFNTDRQRAIKIIGVRFNLWNIAVSASTDGEEVREHPAPFPEQLANDHILSWSNKGDLVLDPFMGSGTTGKMAVIRERQFIGFEIAKEYCEIAEKRIKKAQGQGKIGSWFA